MGAYLVIFFVVLSFPFLSAVRDLPEICNKRCEDHRPRGHKYPYILNCDKTFQSGTPEHASCTNDCSDCPVRVCNANSSDAPPVIFHCPRTTKRHKYCRELCSHRPRGSSMLHCSRDKPQGIDNCLDYCDVHQCPGWICKKNSGIYNCPFDELNYASDICKKYCEISRFEKFGMNHTSAFQFDCSEFQYPEDEQCRLACAAKECPNWICDADLPPFNYSLDPNEYNCPDLITGKTLVTPLPEAKKVKEKCEGRCTNFHFGGGDKYTLACDSFDTRAEQDACRDDCRHCSEDVCNPTTNTVEFYCSDAGSKPQIKVQESLAESPYWYTILVLIVLVTVLVIAVTILGFIFLRHWWKWRKSRARVRDSILSDTFRSGTEPEDFSLRKKRLSSKASLITNYDDGEDTDTTNSTKAEYLSGESGATSGDSSDQSGKVLGKKKEKTRISDLEKESAGSSGTRSSVRKKKSLPLQADPSNASVVAVDGNKKQGERKVSKGKAVKAVKG